MLIWRALLIGPADPSSIVFTVTLFQQLFFIFFSESSKRSPLSFYPWNAFSYNVTPFTSLSSSLCSFSFFIRNDHDNQLNFPVEWLSKIRCSETYSWYCCTRNCESERIRFASGSYWGTSHEILRKANGWRTREVSLYFKLRNWILFIFIVGFFLDTFKKSLKLSGRFQNTKYEIHVKM